MPVSPRHRREPDYSASTAQEARTGTLQSRRLDQFGEGRELREVRATDQTIRAGGPSARGHSGQAGEDETRARARPACPKPGPDGRPGQRGTGGIL